MADETVFLHEGKLLVSNTRVVLDEVTYSTANLTSVRKRERPPDPSGAILLFCLAAASFFAAVAFSDDFQMRLATLLAGVGLASAGVLWLRSMRSIYRLVTTSASGETKVLQSRDGALIDRLASAINEAIVQRG